MVLGSARRLCKAGRERTVSGPPVDVEQALDRLEAVAAPPGRRGAAQSGNGEPGAGRRIVPQEVVEPACSTGRDSEGARGGGRSERETSERERLRGEGGYLEGGP